MLKIMLQNNITDLETKDLLKLLISQPSVLSGLLGGLGWCSSTFKFSLPIGQKSTFVLSPLPVKTSR